MTLNHIVHDLLTILTKSNITDETRIEKRYLEYKIHSWRSKGIRDTYKRNRVINPQWVQYLSNIEFTKVNGADDPLVSDCTEYIGKTVIPTVVSLPKDLGVVRLSTISGTQRYYPISQDRFMGLINGTTRRNWSYVFKIGNSLYIHPFTEQGHINLILDNPMEGFVYDTMDVKSGDLIMGNKYVVHKGNIIHVSVNGDLFPFKKGDIFMAIGTDFKGEGRIKKSVQKRAITKNDVYQMDFTLYEFVIMSILTKDFAIEESKISDIRNDSIDALQKASASA